MGLELGPTSKWAGFLLGLHRMGLAHEPINSYPCTLFTKIQIGPIYLNGAYKLPNTQLMLFRRVS